MDCFLPVSLVAITLYQAHVILSSRKLGVSATVLGPMRMRWLQHQLGLRQDDLPRAQQMKRELLNQCGADTSGVKFVSANLLTDDWLDNRVKTGFDPRKSTFFLWEGVTYYLSREAMEKAFRTIATIAPGSVVVFDYGTDANIKRYRKPLRRLGKAFLKAVREPQTFWISSEPPVKKNLAALMDAYGFSLREQLDYGRETKRKRSRVGLAVAVLETIA